MQNFKYPPEYDDFAHEIAVMSPKVSRVMKATFPARTARSFQYVMSPSEFDSDLDWDLERNVLSSLDSLLNFRNALIMPRDTSRLGILPVHLYSSCLAMIPSFYLGYGLTRTARPKNGT